MYGDEGNLEEYQYDYNNLHYSSTVCICVHCNLKIN